MSGAPPYPSEDTGSLVSQRRHNTRRAVDHLNHVFEIPPPDSRHALSGDAHVRNANNVDSRDLLHVTTDGFDLRNDVNDGYAACDVGYNLWAPRAAF